MYFNSTFAAREKFEIYKFCTLLNVSPFLMFDIATIDDRLGLYPLLYFPSSTFSYVCKPHNTWN